MATRTSADAASWTADNVMTASEVADLLKLPLSTVYEYARRGVLPCHPLGRHIRFLRDEIEESVRDQRRE